MSNLAHIVRKQHIWCERQYLDTTLVNKWGFSDLRVRTKSVACVSL